MNEIKKIYLDFSLALDYFSYSLDEANALSIELTKIINFKEGNFYTLLTTNTYLSKINNFKFGGIGSGILQHISSIIEAKINSNNKLSCVFDNILEDYSPDYNEEIFNECGMFYNNEMYYLVNRKNVSIQLIKDCLYISNAAWHSLCVFSEFEIRKDQKELKIDDIKKICASTRLIMINAYDAEGYIFWERNR